MRADITYQYDVVDSTNDEAKRLLSARRRAKHGTIITASEQTNGRGRLGKSFASPGGDSIYVSFILKPPEDPAEQRITAFAAVAVCLAIEKTTSYRPGIKWINDIYLEGKKICGILAESVPSAVVLGIGININQSQGSFPDELRESAGSLIMNAEERARLFECLQEEVFRCMAVAERPGTVEAVHLMDEYRTRSVLLKKGILLSQGNTTIPAFCEDLANDGALIVRFIDGSVEELRSGDITVQLV